ncbi:exported hypothetical protein [Candidatus Competibacter denitrificans Run_A_D11]|uniref:Uncharacterized protein n=1 Tax=Candidatus Competibacter denitrificans Run_A_D11 TaxID=1400863 RepID=W6MA37_9GAMM|nr:hypothetical protein [Candidatus Competibacter denitrificans]CDI03544.1 exported hypothetical protein [Candidatus Competibacter denitrificans Run_A_D11]
MRNKFLLSLVSVMLLSAHYDNAVAERLNPEDITYLGAFKPPLTDFYQGMGAIGATMSITFRPDGNPSGCSGCLPGSLIISHRGKVAELTIPTPVKSSNYDDLKTVTELKAISGFGTYCSSGPCDRLGGVYYIGARAGQSAKLYYGTYIYYNVAASDNPTVGYSNSVDILNPSYQGTWHVGPPANGNVDSWSHGNKHGEYFFAAPQAWADQYTGGRSIIEGRLYGGTGCCGGSMGPALTAIGPWIDGPPAQGANISGVPLIYFNSGTSHIGNDKSWMDFRYGGDPGYSYYSVGDALNGGAWVERGGKKAIILFGRHGTYNGIPTCPITDHDNGCHGAIDTNTIPFCYGGGGTDCPWGIAAIQDKGYHAGPYEPRFTFIDPDELAQVAQGTRAPNSIDSYAFYNPKKDWPWQDPDGAMSITGGAFDEANGYLYVVQSNGWILGRNMVWPIIHVYKVNSSSNNSSDSPNTTPLSNPPNLRIITSPTAS